MTTAFAATAAGTFTVGVQVTDDEGATGVDTTTVTVSVVPATPGLVVNQSAGSTVVNENGTSDSVTVSLASQPTDDVTVTISSGDTGEISVGTAALTFTPDNWNVDQTFVVTGVADGIVDGDQTVDVTLTVSSQDADYAAISDSEIVATNQDTDTTPDIPAQIITPDFVVRPHLISAGSVQTAILFVAHATGTMTVVPIGTASVGESIRILDGDVQQVSQFVNGAAQATVNAGGLYAIIFEAHSSDRMYSVGSTAGTDAFSLTATNNFLQPTDTNGDSQTTALDALVVVNRLNEMSDAAGEPVSDPSWVDVNADGAVTALDALIVINQLNRSQDPGSDSTPAGESLEAWDLAAPVQVFSLPSANEDRTESEELGIDASVSEVASSNTSLNGGLLHQDLVDQAFCDAFIDGVDDDSDDSHTDLQLLTDDGFDLSWL
ncbi:Alkaline phosphatase [Rhodopirellula islandica]|uniref:Alkaline phosphatase n=1 Tax=Rhodopirellula islandica TaxID=595434 RepID=A0A0J1B6D0_RHOIS|nr:Alkaline phosphatase [Rhodopirellula islandica]